MDRRGNRVHGQVRSEWRGWQPWILWQSMHIHMHLHVSMDPLTLNIYTEVHPPVCTGTHTIHVATWVSSWITHALVSITNGLRKSHWHLISLATISAFMELIKTANAARLYTLSSPLTKSRHTVYWSWWNSFSRFKIVTALFVSTSRRVSNNISGVNSGSETTHTSLCA